MKQTVSAGGVVLNEENKVLVVSQHGDSWSLPKGHIDQDESAEEAAVREIYEESGVESLTLLKKLGEYERYKIGLDGTDDLTERKKIIVFLFTTDHGKLEPVHEDHPEVRWVEIEEVANLLTHREDKKFFENITEELK